MLEYGQNVALLAPCTEVAVAARRALRNVINQWILLISTLDSTKTWIQCSPYTCCPCSGPYGGICCCWLGGIAATRALGGIMVCWPGYTCPDWSNANCGIWKERRGSTVINTRNLEKQQLPAVQASVEAASKSTNRYQTVSNHQHDWYTSTNTCCDKPHWRSCKKIYLWKHLRWINRHLRIHRINLSQLA